MAYYKINEIFKHKKELYRCVEEKEMEDGCSKCALFSLGCIGAECSSDSRWDEKSVYFVQVYEPECGMLFRASDGVLYKFCHKKDLHGDIECACHENGLKCKDIFKQAFENFEFEKFDIHCIKEEETEDSAILEEIKRKDTKPEVCEDKRKIEMIIERVRKNYVTIKIVKQTHRLSNFSQQKNRYKFVSSRGFELMSYSCATKRENVNGVYVIGTKPDEHRKNTFNIRPDMVAELFFAVNEYNETNGIGAERQWPQNGDLYYVIGETGDIHSHICAEIEEEDKRKEFGNFFKTREEAMVALKKVKTALKKE